MHTLTDLLGAEVSAIGHVPQGASVVAYALFRGVTLAALGPGTGEASAALRGKIERFLPQLGALVEVAAAEDVNLVVETPGRPPVRKFVRPLSPERALLELDLGVEGAIVFREPGSGTFAVLSRAHDGTPQMVHLGEPVRGDDAAARPLPVPQRTPSPAAERELRATKQARVRALLRCPLCKGPLTDVATGLACGPCGREFPALLGKPVLATAEGYDASPKGKLESQNTYGQQVLELIESHRDGLVLDLGSGSPSLGFYNVVHLDLSAYDQVDVVTDGRGLPFADATFDAILSEAVLEHVRDPDEYMTELVRVLKPGGRVRLDVAFLQPYHAYPDHFFNMTKSGLTVTVERAGLRLLGIGVGEHQQPWVALGLLLAAFVHATHDPARKAKVLQTTFGEALELFQKGGNDAFRGVAPDQVERLAAGFWCLCQKPIAP
ncbi:MAG: methyltransferase domain-containing protein [Planctomycetes bacterium]|nr:methyltransferase domain-containing protein [Planctomycetota bacterium]